MLKLKEQRGMTLIELIVAMAIMSIVIMLASSLNIFGWRSFGTSTSQANIQQEVRLVDQIIKAQLRNVTVLTTNSESLLEPKELSLSGDRFHYGENRQLTAEWIENIKIYTKENGKILAYEIIAKDSRYNVKNEILLNNTTLQINDTLELKEPDVKLYYINN